ncbi:MAG: DUF2236 domain-containing protein [Polyangiaceae bacterium]|nr:DUF2236 domain-containing protein [Polyangiaceae bacterium]
MNAIDSEATWVSESDVRRGLERLKREPLDPREGLFGPRSMFWEVNKHAIVYFAGAVQSVQMQLAHPWVATAVYEHSKIMSAPRKRAQLTYIYLWSLIYGDLDTVSKKSLSLYKIHTHVHGTLGEGSSSHPAGKTYSANEVNALLWVHVTAFYCRVKLYEALIRPLSESEKDRFCSEAKLYAYCFGIPEEAHPSTWKEVDEYVAAMQASKVLAPSDAGLRISRFMRDSIPRPFRSAVWAFLCLSLPADTRKILQLPEPSAGNRRRRGVMTSLLRLAIRLLPARLGLVPAYHEATRRLAGESGADWLTSSLYRLFLGVPKLVN